LEPLPIFDKLSTPPDSPKVVGVSNVPIIEWSWKNDANGYTSYDDKTIGILEQAYQADPKGTIILTHDFFGKSAGVYPDVKEKAITPTPSIIYPEHRRTFLFFASDEPEIDTSKFLTLEDVNNLCTDTTSSLIEDPLPPPPIELELIPLSTVELITFPSHPQHKMQYKPSLPNVNCQICKFQLSGGSYSCHECDYHICINCGSLDG